MNADGGNQDWDKTIDAVVAQAESMSIDVTSVSHFGENAAVLSLRRVPRGTRVPGASPVDTSDGELHIDRRGDFTSFRLEADSRVRRFGALRLFAPRPPRAARKGQVRVGRSPLDVVFGIEGSPFAVTFLRQAERALMQLARHRCRLIVEADHINLDVEVAGELRDVRRLVAALFVIWRLARPLRGRGGSPRSPRPTQKKAKGRPPPAERAADRLTTWVDAATTPYSGSAARVRDTVQAQVSLDGHGFSDISGTLVFGFSTLRTRIHEMGLRATLELPPSPHAFQLSPQRGWRGLLARFTDDIVGVTALDAAYIIHLHQTPAPFVASIAPSLLAVVPRRPTVHVASGRMVLQLEHMRTSEKKLRRDIEGALNLWRVVARRVAGLADDT